MSETHHDNPPLCQSRIIITIQHGKIRPHGFRLWPRIYLRHDRVFLARIKIIRFPHNSVKIRFPVSRLHGKLFRVLPTIRQQMRNVRFCQNGQQAPVYITYGKFVAPCLYGKNYPRSDLLPDEQTCYVLHFQGLTRSIVFH